MSGVRVGVVRGGPSSEYDISLQTGSEVLRRLPERYKKFDILIDKEGNWHLDGFQKEPGRIFREIDIIFNALHGEFGEDGQVQQIFESHNVKYTGSQIFPSLVSFRKDYSRQLFGRAGIKTPQYLVFKKSSAGQINSRFFEFIAYKGFHSFPPPWVVKPVSRGSSLGVSICLSFQELVKAVKEAFSWDERIIIEEYIKGREASCGVLEDFRGEKYYPLPVVEIVPPPGRFFDYSSKYTGLAREICPSSFDNETKREIERLAVETHKILGCRHYSRADFIVSKKGIYVLEVNALPGLTANSLFPKSAEVAGISFENLLDHFVKLALD